MNINDISKEDLEELLEAKQEALENNDLEILEEALLDLGYDLDYAVEILLYNE